MLKSRSQMANLAKLMGMVQGSSPGVPWAVHHPVDLQIKELNETCARRIAVVPLCGAARLTAAAVVSRAPAGFAAEC